MSDLLDRLQGMVDFKHDDVDVAREAIEEIIRLRAEQGEVRGYLSRLLQSSYPSIEILPDMLGVCTQIDNVLAGRREEITRLRVELQQQRERRVVEHEWRLRKYGAKSGELVSRWQNTPPAYRNDEWCQLDDAIVDALHQGGVYAWVGDGVGMVRNIVEASVRAALAPARREGMVEAAQIVKEIWEKFVKSLPNDVCLNVTLDGEKIAPDGVDIPTGLTYEAAIRAAAKEEKP